MQLFGEAVLGLSQGSVSELLSKPKSWQMLSIKGREPFIRMQLWLTDPHNIEKLQHLKTKRREVNKRNRTTDQGHDLQLDNFGDFRVSSPESSMKKPRVLLSDEQREALHLAYALDPFPSSHTIEFISNELKLSPRTVNSWFHKQKLRLRQVSQNHSEDPRESSNPPLDPLHFRILLSRRLLQIRQEKETQDSFHIGLTQPLGTLPGLDLSPKSEIGSEYSGSAVINDDSNMSGGDRSPLYREAVDVTRDDNRSMSSGTSSSNSNEKAVVPVWANPDWQADCIESKKQVLINGVCVVQTKELTQSGSKSPINIATSDVVDDVKQSLNVSNEIEEINENMPDPPAVSNDENCLHFDVLRTDMQSEVSSKINAVETLS